ncbi:MBL fold metallo-hydrolase [Chitinophaga caeni]|uniref:MBL fold metallo-hydrolase n=1 Tax=Chitinophaga caeni TaxID=2029983 RepID=A0A291R140_9BACT|nr:MBL fold metallo-hydrolase [Chitinophaga caeni]ATL49824.1 MBL fold metallo-hydrolase [Chitinophaga caeni]
MNIKQFYDKPLAQASYAVWNNGQMILVDPSRDPKPYYDLAASTGSKIMYVLETHPHADFVSSHLQIHRETGAQILVNDLVGVSYPYQSFNHGDTIQIGGNATIKALHTPGHSPDSNTYLLMDEHGQEVALFTGDFLFIGDVGRPDLREGAGKIHAKRQELARQMHQSIQNILPQIDGKAVVYPAHGAGSLCGKNLSDELSDTLANQRITNWALQDMSEEEFVESLLADQPFIPKYFPFDVEINRNGAESLAASIAGIPSLQADAILDEDADIVDTRPEADFKAGHLKGAINIQAAENDKYETWLGSLVDPGKAFYIVVPNDEDKANILERTAKIGYETAVKGVIVGKQFPVKDITRANVKGNPDESGEYYIVDIRQKGEHATNNIFETSVNIPLAELKDRASEIKTGKPVLIHCAGGYRSAVGASLLQSVRPDLKIVDLSTDINNFKQALQH